MARSVTRQSLATPIPQFPEDERLARLAAVVQALLEELHRIQQLLAGGTAGQLLTKSAAADYAGAWRAAPAAGVVGAKNLGSGHIVWKDLASGLLEFKTLKAGLNITLTDTDTDITIAASSTITLSWLAITGKPTTLGGYGITDAVPATRKVNTGAYLTGGGALSGDLTLDVNLAALPPQPDTVLTWLDM